MTGRLLQGLLLAAFVGPAVAAPPPSDQTIDRTESHAGRFLVATEELRGPVFSETVILMIEHDSEGAFGLVINRPLGRIEAAKVFGALGIDPDVGTPDRLPVHMGGPVNAGAVFMLHSPEVRLEITRDVADGISVSAASAMLETIAHGDGPRHWLLLFGYAGWGAGQLEGEIERGSWAVMDARAEIVFDPDDAAKWRRVYGPAGAIPIRWTPGDP